MAKAAKMNKRPSKHELRMCVGKVKWPSETSAWTAAKIGVAPYFCKYCKKWHVGHFSH